MLDAGVLDDGLDLGVRNVNTKDDPGLGLVEVIFDLLLAGERVNHIGNSANFVNSVKTINGFGGVGHADGDAVALLGAEGFQSGGDLVDFFDHFFVGDFRVKILECGIVGPLAG